MNILYLTPQRPNLVLGEVADYMSDLLFHGLRTLYGDRCVDIPKKIHMYQNYPHTKQLWGKGFSYAETLIDIEVDREDIVQKIQNNFFDLIVVSIHHSIQLHFDYCTMLFEQSNLPMDKTIVVDGHDWPKYNPNYFKYTRAFFKREIETNNKLKPVWFAIPQTKIVNEIPQKTKDFSFITPGSCESHWPKDSRQTHIYEQEADYYKDYQEAYFGLTCKKGGWDCMRHCEILANGCIPVFTDIELCPTDTLINLPKSLLSDIKRMNGLHLAASNNELVYGGHQILHHKSYINHDIFNKVHYVDLSTYLLEYTKDKLTTEFLAKYVLGNY